MPALVDDATIERMKERATAAMAAAKQKYPERTILRGVGVVSSPRATDPLPTSKSLKELTGPPQVKGLSAKVKAARERAAVAAKRKAKFGVTSNRVGDVQKGTDPFSRRSGSPRLPRPCTSRTPSRSSVGQRTTSFPSSRLGC